MYQQVATIGALIRVNPGWTAVRGHKLAASVGTLSDAIVAWDAFKNQLESRQGF
ncbi:hypothetical protein [Methylomonas albis]|nr:hypothetical protein [Methylomonas albis]